MKIVINGKRVDLADKPLAKLGLNKNVRLALSAALQVTPRVRWIDPDGVQFLIERGDIQ